VVTTTASGSFEGGAAFVAATTAVAASASAFLASASAFLTFLAGAALAPAPPRLPLPVLVSFSGFETTTGSVFLLSLCLGAFVSAAVAAATVAAAAFPRLETFLAGGSLGLDSTVSSDFSVLASLFSLLLPPFLL